MADTGEANRQSSRATGWGMVDLVVVAAYLGTALHVLSGLVGRTSTGYLSQGVQDHQAFEWYFGASAHNVATLSNPLFSDRQNFPDGVNLMANAAVTGLGVPLAPLTLALGAHVTFFVVELLGLAGHRRRLVLVPAPARARPPGGGGRRLAHRLRAGDGLARQRAPQLRRAVPHPGHPRPASSAWPRAGAG